MRAPTTVKLVRGRHAETPVPEVVQRLGWKYRTAVVMDSYVAGLVDMFFDSALFLRFLEAMDGAIQGTAGRVRIEEPQSQKIVEMSSVAELEAFYQGLLEEERDLPEEVVWFDVGMIAGGFAERWYAVGGPEIYHDSFTFSVFTQK